MAQFGPPPDFKIVPVPGQQPSFAPSLLKHDPQGAWMPSFRDAWREETEPAVWYVAVQGRTAEAVVTALAEWFPSFTDRLLPCPPDPQVNDYGVVTLKECVRGEVQQIVARLDIEWKAAGYAKRVGRFIAVPFKVVP